MQTPQRGAQLSPLPVGHRHRVVLLIGVGETKLQELITEVLSRLRVCFPDVRRHLLLRVGDVRAERLAGALRLDALPLFLVEVLAEFLLRRRPTRPHHVVDDILIGLPVGGSR